MKNVIVTGATSFIGSNLIQRLIQRDYNVIAIVRPNTNKLHMLPDSPKIRIYEVDMSDYNDLDKIIGSKCECYLSLAWNGTRGEERDNTSLQEANYKYSINALSSVLSLGCTKIISAGSQAEYGIYNDIISESHICNPTTKYGHYKLKFFEDAYKLCKENKVSFKEARFFSLYGHNDYEGTMIISTIKKMLNNEVCNFTEAKQMWNFLHINDAINGITALMEKDCQDGAYNFGSDDTRKLSEFIKEIKLLCNSSSVINFGAVPYPPTGIVSIQPDNTKLKKETGWIPKIDFYKGIDNIIAYLRESSNEKN